MTVLVLAGTAEGRALVGALAERGVAVVASLAGVTERPEALAAPVRVGGFGGAEGFRDYLRTVPVRAVVDATHPFAARMGPRSAAVCAEEGLPYLRLLRPAWAPGPGDDWREVGGPEEVADVVPEDARIFLAVGAQRAAEFGALAGRAVVLRVADPGAAPVPGWRVIAGRPGDAAAEEALFREEGVDWLVARNSGGTARGKLDAARALGLPVALMRRPPVPEGERVSTVGEAVDWVLRP
ncbi:cobalt-precorrin-6A reductase [Histidinibacterium aquaticum]|uniref:Cobalt-precorrin-6A reductase n=1 Tax=Histidinibacterium aquaticum TaxID=2613962 RepID=A0A5J5GN17_9RHOB|nr:cobalt-precorrin-6A reductase [Histidinibacterium aquaticum]KAA9008934.1 cobalt-precorrin-6A reductase [Histidinibacterium aquaticum]